VGAADGVGDTEGFGVATFTPLSHTNFLPLFIHVYLTPLTVEVTPALLQVAPAFVAADA
jgi:hypothetical protein